MKLYYNCGAIAEHITDTVYEVTGCAYSEHWVNYCKDCPDKCETQNLLEYLQYYKDMIQNAELVSEDSIHEDDYNYWGYLPIKDLLNAVRKDVQFNHVSSINDASFRFCLTEDCSPWKDKA